MCPRIGPFEAFPTAAAKVKLENRYADDFCTGADTRRGSRTCETDWPNFVQMRIWNLSIIVKCFEAFTGRSELFRKAHVRHPSGKNQGLEDDTRPIELFVGRASPPVRLSKRVAKLYDVMDFFAPTVFLAKQFVQCPGFSSWSGINHSLKLSLKSGEQIHRGLQA